MLIPLTVSPAVIIPLCHVNGFEADPRSVTERRRRSLRPRAPFRRRLIDGVPAGH